VDGLLFGVFGTELSAKEAFKSSVAKKSEAEGISVHHRVDHGLRLSFLDSADYPERIQGYSRVASISDHALYFFPSSGRLGAPDGELAVLLGSFRIPGTLELLDGAVAPEVASSSLRGTVVSEYRAEERDSESSVFDASHARARPDFASAGTLVYVDRVFTVKGAGTVALGFILSGKVSVHDTLRPIPGAVDVNAEVRGVQVDDVDFDSAGRGIRVGLSLRGVEPKDIERSHWLDDGSHAISDTIQFELAKSPFYKQEVDSRELHMQLPGEMLPAKVSRLGGAFTAHMPSQVPVWEGMRGAVVDLNGKGLRVVGGATCKL
jgi:hypothetical protein